ncbi:hypothetical protein RHMOL_Rhmol11G0105500 [Rhododendron molle]|uniref:Uncharacterized protein n=1 Tax=Rhododendron molle TaxID=49168 RepID=A0ACC0LS79_RHOML|nr:hypothetical protein RHMOL_Rhmol11G0105500 [Rhododendron molle]
MQMHPNYCGPVVCVGLCSLLLFLYEHIYKTNVYLIVLKTGGGHYSPIDAYHSGNNMALILDVASFQYHFIGYPGSSFVRP